MARLYRKGGLMGKKKKSLKKHLRKKRKQKQKNNNLGVGNNGTK